MCRPDPVQQQYRNRCPLLSTYLTIGLDSYAHVDFVNFLVEQFNYVCLIKIQLLSIFIVSQ